MRPIKLYWDETTGSVYLHNDNTFYIGIIPQGTHGVQEHLEGEGQKNTTLVTAGLSAEDIVLLKQNGVI